MSSKYTPTAKMSKPTSSSTIKHSTPSGSITPIKPVRATLSTTKKLSAGSRPTLVKQQSECELRERLRITQNDILNTAFSSPFTSSTKFGSSKSKLSNPLASSTQSLTGTSASATSKNLFGNGSTPNNPVNVAKRLFDFSTPTGSGGDRLASTHLTSTPECFSRVVIDAQTPKKTIRNGDETPHSYRKSDESSLNDARTSREVGSEVSNLTVAVRVRPMNARECTTPLVTRVICVQNANEVKVKTSSTEDTYAYDNVFCSYDSDDIKNYANQETVFNGTALPLIEKAFEGYNACLFAYGQTGSGKSYSMMGIDTDDGHSKPNSEAGIIPRFCYELFRRIDEMKSTFSAEVEVSYFEIYNEKIHDLLAVTPTHLASQATPGGTQAKQRQALQIREHPQWGPYIENLNIHPVDSNFALKNWLAVGNSQRATAATGMNDKSSRSHSIFSIILTLSEIDSQSSKLITKRSRISLVDLAGSERVSQTCASGERLKEGVSINRSLLTLGRVINALADPKKNTFAPYRESVLTWLLKESLGGNSKTVMLATISPASLHLDETLATLRYACQARSIVNRVKVNEDSNNREIHKLRTEVDRLRAQIQYYKRQEIQAIEAPPRKIIIETIEANPNDEEEKEKLRQQLREREQELANAEKSWRERLREANNKCKNEMKLLQQNGLALKLSVAQKHPCLINLTADPILSGTLLYILPVGTVRIGRPKPAHQTQSDIVLDGPLVGSNHCEIENRQGKLYIRPGIDDCETFVNGQLIADERQIYHGDRIVIGGSHYFRLSNPKCPHRAQAEIVDYETAHQEVLREQEKRLRMELMAEQQAAIRKIEDERTKHELSYNEKLAQLELEKFRYMCSKEMIDAEKEVLARNQLDESVFEYRPFESDLCERIKRIMERPTEEGMHENQLLVKEATQRCRNLGLNYEFVQTLVPDESDVFKAIIKIVDRSNNRYAEWPTARLSVWLDLMRDSNDITAENAFDSVDIMWLESDEEIAMNESLNSSRISLNLSAMKETLLGMPMKSCFKSIQNKLSPWSFRSQSKTNVINSQDSPVQKKKLFFDDSEGERIENSADAADHHSNATPKTPFGSAISSSTPSANRHQAKLDAFNDLRKTLVKIKKLYQNDTENMEQQIAGQKALPTWEEIEQMTIRQIMQKNEPSPRKTPKSVRFNLD